MLPYTLPFTELTNIYMDAGGGICYVDAFQLCAHWRIWMDVCSVCALLIKDINRFQLFCVLIYDASDYHIYDTPVLSFMWIDSHNVSFQFSLPFLFIYMLSDTAPNLTLLLWTMTCLFPMLERWLLKSGTHFFFSDLLTASNRVRSPPYLCIGTFSGEYHSVALFDSSGKYVPPMPGRILYHIWVNFLHSEFIPAWNTFE